MEIYLGVGGAIISIAVTIISYFLKVVLSDVRIHTLDIGKNKGQIELVKQKQAIDHDNLSKTLSDEITHINKNISEMKEMIQTLISK